MDTELQSIPTMKVWIANRLKPSAANLIAKHMRPFGVPTKRAHLE